MFYNKNNAYSKQKKNIDICNEVIDIYLFTYSTFFILNVLWSNYFYFSAMLYYVLLPAE